MTKLLPAFLLCASSFFLFSCDKSDKASSKARLQVYLTDAPAAYEEVHVDVRDIRVNYSSDTSSGWTSLTGVQTGDYDLLKLANGQDTLLADAEVNSGRIQQIRLVLGPNNYVKTGGQTFPLETPSAQQSGLKLNIHQDVTAGILYKLIMDFDAGRSIVKTGNNRYILKPVIRTTLEAAGGSLRGYVLPNSFSTHVYALRGADTVAGTVTSNGSYQIRGLSGGTYNLAFVPTNAAYQNQSRSGIQVTNNAVTTVDTVRLVQ